MENNIGRYAQFPTIDGIIIAQAIKSLDVLGKVVKQFDTIIEIGYCRGGLTQWFFNNKKIRGKVIGYDITDNWRSSQNYHFSDEIEFNVCDCFSDFAVNKIQNQIKFGGKVLLFCDGGSKETEFNIFSKYLKEGDVVMIHDYFDDRVNEPYASDIEEWTSGPESFYNHIKNSILSENLEEYMYEDFRKCLIGSFVKKS